MSQGGVPGYGPNQDNVKASDADRERIVEQLRRHAAEGRLTMDEFEERMSAAYEARTYGALAELTRDLPVELGTPGSPGQRGAGQGRSGGGRPWDSRSSSGAPVDVASVADAAMAWRMNRHELRHQLRNQMRQQSRGGQVARRSRGRAAAGLAATTAGWASLSVLLTGIWFLAGLTDGNGFGDFWPAWPIGILGLLTAVKYVKFFVDRD
jgi:hypothetical protein